MIEKTFERIADALELNNKLLREGLDFRKSLVGETAAPAKEAKAPKPEKAAKPEVLPDPEPEEDNDGLGDDAPAAVVTKADIREFHKTTSAKGDKEAAKVKAFFIPELTKRGAIKDGKPNLAALPEEDCADFMAAFKAAVA